MKRQGNKTVDMKQFAMIISISLLALFSCTAGPKPQEKEGDD